MKKLVSIFVFLALLLQGCDKHYNLTSSQSSLELSDIAYSDSLTIYGGGKSFKTTHVPSWITTEITDSLVKYTVEANTSGISRNDSIVVKCGKSYLSIPVLQYNRATKLEFPDGKKVKIPTEGGTQELACECDGGVIIENVQSPLEVKYQVGKFIVTAPENKGYTKKNVINITAGDFKEEVEIWLQGEPCPTCKGKGTLECPNCDGYGLWGFTNTYVFGCEICGGGGMETFVHGSGYYVKDNYREGKGRITCPTCKGIG